MKSSEELNLFARQLTAAGLPSYEWSVPIPGKGAQIGLMVASIGFFPLWELDEPANAGLIMAHDFTTLKSNRPANWEMVEPRLWDAEPKGE